MALAHRWLDHIFCILLKSIFSFMSLERSWLADDEHKHVNMWHLNRAPCQKKMITDSFGKKKASAQITKFDSEVWGLMAPNHRIFNWVIICFDILVNIKMITGHKMSNRTITTWLSSVPGIYVCSMKVFANCHFVIQPRVVRWRKDISWTLYLVWLYEVR